jgi:hypothetical protein
MFGGVGKSIINKKEGSRPPRYTPSVIMFFLFLAIAAGVIYFILRLS